MTPGSDKTKRRHRGISPSHVGAFLGGMIVATMFLTLFHGSILHATQQLDSFAEKELNINVALPNQKNVQLELKTREYDLIHPVAGLDCSEHGGPSSTKITQELVYWKDLPLDNKYVSPLKSISERQYLTFEPDGGK